MPVAQGGVVDERELLTAAAVTAEVGTPFNGELRAGRERQGDYLRVRMTAARPLLAPAEFVQRLFPHPAVVAAEEDRRQQGQLADQAAVEPGKHRAEVAGVVSQGCNPQA